jgi:hypothetical protein
MCLNVTYSRVHIGKNLSDKFTGQYGMKQGDALSPLLFNFILAYAVRRVQEQQGHISFWPMLMMLIFWEKT